MIVSYPAALQEHSTDGRVCFARHRHETAFEGHFENMPSYVREEGLKHTFSAEESPHKT